MTGNELHYNGVARALHWGIAVLIIVNLILGIFHHDMAQGFPVIPIHKSIGLTVLVLSGLRLAWRLIHRPPPLPAPMARGERAAAHGLHWILYALMFAMPVTGWIIASAGDRPLTWFWLFAVPKLPVTKGDAIADIAHQGHMILGYMMAALVVGHIGAALRHHFWIRDGVLRRML